MQGGRDVQRDEAVGELGQQSVGGHESRVRRVHLGGGKGGQGADGGPRDQALPTAAFLAAAKFPSATFTAHAFRYLGGERYLAIGQLTLRGVSKPLTLPFTLAITGLRARMKASLDLNRLAFGVGQDEWKATTALPAAVTVSIAIAASRAP